MAINDILEIGRQGLTAQREALQTTSSNIANVNTPGYTRRRALLANTDTPAAGGKLQGSGVEVEKVVRVHDDFVQKQILEQSHSFGGLQARASQMKQIESMVSRDGQQLGDQMNKFFNDVRQLSANPETASLRNVVANSAQSLSQSFRSMNSGIEDMRHQIDLRLGQSVDEINTMTKQIANLNDAISMAESRGEVPNDLYDKRDQTMRDLSQKLDFQTSVDQRGGITIIAGGTALVQGNDSHDLSVVRTPATKDKPAGSVDILVQSGGKGRTVTAGIKDGELGGLVYIRDHVLTPAQHHLDQLAYQLATAVNAVHREGSGIDGQAGRDLFSPITKVEGAAHDIDLSDAIKNNHELVAAGSSMDTPGDNRIALKIADIQSAKLLPAPELGQHQHHTLNESLNSLVGGIGTQTQRDDAFFQHQKSLVDQLNNYRESLSGVNLEEEAVNMLQYQTAFNAAAKAMKVGEQLYDTILKLKE